MWKWHNIIVYSVIGIITAVMWYFIVICFL